MGRFVPSVLCKNIKFLRICINETKRDLKFSYVLPLSFKLIFEKTMQQKSCKHYIFRIINKE